MIIIIRWICIVIISMLGTFGFYHHKNIDKSKMDSCLIRDNLAYKDGNCVREQRLEIVTPSDKQKE